MEKELLYKQKLIELGKQNKLILRLLFYYYCYVKKDLTPPQMFNYVGGEEFVEIGKGYFNMMKDHGGLKPHHKILDIGSGIGRVAMNFIDYLNEDGQYEGFDIVKYGSRWCNAKIARKHSGFNFRHVNIYNKEYNKKGNVDGENFIFPYSNDFFDFAFATSVFTHMLPDAVRQYFRQIHRVLNQDGVFLGSFFILNAESEKLMSDCKFNFKRVHKNYGVMNVDNPEQAIAYKEEFLEKIFEKVGFSIIPPVYYGGWSGRKGLVSGQDMLFLKKTSAL